MTYMISANALRFHLRRSALRVLSSSPSTYLAKPRTFASLSPAFRIPRQSTVSSFQRRWATGEAEAQKQEGENLVTETEPTPQEEVENAIQSDNATDSAADTIVKASETATSESAHAENSSEQSVVDATVSDVKEAGSNVAGSIKNAAEGVREAVTDAGASGYVPRRSPREGQQTPKPTLYIGNLFFDVTENDLVKELARFGTITKCRLMRDSRGLSKGFGYVDFETTESATKAIETLNQQLFEGRRLTVQYAAFETSKMEQSRGSRDKPMNPPSKTLFIGNMSFEMTDRDLNDLFRGVRNVIDVRVAIDRRTGQPRGFAHADFVDIKSAMEAMTQLQGKETYGRRLRLDYSYGAGVAPRTRPNDE